jgi:hypothetical protein
MTIMEYKKEIDKLDKYFAKNDQINANTILNKLYKVEDHKIICLLGYYLASVMYNEAIKKMINDFFSYEEYQIQVKKNNYFPVYCTDIRNGALFEINLECFEEEEPIIAYCDDHGSNAEAGSGLVYVGTAQIRREPWMWLDNIRSCVLFKANKSRKQGNFPSLLSLTTGEFCTEIYHCKHDGSFVLIDRNDFNFK